MRHFVPLLFVVLSLCTALAACGSDDDETESDPNSLNTLGDEITAAHCSRVLNCCDAAERASAFGGLPVSNEEECLSSVEGIIQVNVIPRYEAALERGTITYDSSGVQNCVDGLLRVACVAFEPDPRFAIEDIPACRGLFTAQLETTEFCTENFECKTGFCALGESGEEGTCAEQPRNGDPCLANQCAFNLYCDENDTCAAQLPDDSGCAFDAQCQSLNCVDVAPPERSADLRCQPLPPACGG
jgi:hypothetical protein